MVRFALVVLLLASGAGAEERLRLIVETDAGGDPDEAAAELRAFAHEADLALDAALDLFESRTGFLAARGIDVGRIRFSTAFGRGVAGSFGRQPIPPQLRRLQPQSSGHVVNVQHLPDGSMMVPQLPAYHSIMTID